MLELYRNIKKFRTQNEMSQAELARLTGYTDRSSIAKIEKGLVDLSLSKIEAFADALGVDPGELMGDDWESTVVDNARLDIADHFDYNAFDIAKFQEAEHLDATLGENRLEYNANPLNRIPIYGTIPAGIPIAAIQDIEGYEEIDPSMLRGGKRYFGLKVKGNSMYPMFMEGDTIVVRQQPDCESGQVCAVRVNGDDATLKKVIKQGSTTILQPLNPEYEPMFFVGSAGEPSLEIMGVVVEIRRKL